MNIPDNRDKTGKWIKNRFHEDIYTCSECVIQTHNKYWYCPGCGAKMDMKEVNRIRMNDEMIAIEELKQKMNEICQKCPNGKSEWCGDCHFDELAEVLGIELYWQGD